MSDESTEEVGMIERLRNVAEEAIARLSAAKAELQPLRDAIDHVIAEIKALRVDDTDDT
jgi:hypothetical protein